MKEFFRTKSFRILLAVVAGLCILAIVTAITGGFAIPNLLGAISTPMQKVSTVVANNAADTAADLTRSKESLQAENDALKAQVQQLTSQLVDYYQLQQENEQLRSFLELKEQNQDYQMVTGSVVGRDPSDLFYSFRVDKGTLSGVRVNDPVITEDGVVGFVSSVSSMYCNVTSILSPDTKIAAIDKVSQESGVVTSDLTLADQGLVRMNWLETGDLVQEGDIVVTSGIAGIFPKDLKIGTVKEIRNSENDVSRYAVIEPFADVKTVKDVLIITDFQGQGEALADLTYPSTALTTSPSSLETASSSAASQAASSSEAAAAGSSAVSSQAASSTGSEASP